MPVPQRITPELQRWIVDQATSGQSPDAVLRAMRDSGWSAAVAEQALEDTLRDHLADRSHALALPPKLRVPEPLCSDGSLSIDLTEEASAEVRQVRVLSSLTNPRIVLFGGLLSAAECDELVALAGARLARSETVESSTGGGEINESRTSDGMFFGREENPLCARIERRIAELLRWPLERG
ncbi:MAG: 2-oxoglutarate-dependent dioxygenase, partial [Rhizobacter sp.]|nr:2-oxoglutarate-dependent dioxygenase [Rhizobacter sp.]